MIYSLEGKTALVTGGARRIGREIALTLAKHGADIVIHYGKSVALAEQTAQDIRQIGRRVALLQADLTYWSQAEQLGIQAIAAFGSIDILVNNAASFVKAQYPNVTEAAFDEAFNINLKAPFVLGQVIAKHMIERRSPPLTNSSSHYGNIINITDESAFRAFKSFSAHSVAKAALLALTRVQAVTLGPHVRVNAICPGVVLKPDTQSEANWNAYRNLNPLQALGSAEQVAEAVLFLVAGPQFVNGDCLMLDGGEFWMEK